MASRIISIITSTLPLIFSILALSFTAASFASRDWVRQHYFPPELQPLDWKDPVFTIYRSPFVLCSANPFKNGTEEEILRYDLVCTRFAVTGRGKTACQTPNETDSYSSITGDWRMCQQIHLSGNLVLAALVFASVALAVVIGLSVVFIQRAAKEGQSVSSTAAPTTEEAPAGDVAGEGEEAEGSHAYKGTSSSTSPGTTQQGTNTTSTASQPPIQSLAVIITTYIVLTFLSITAMCVFLSQFYGILGLVQSQPDNGLWASLSLGSVQDQQTGDLHHAPWVQGDVLTIYMSLAWLSSALAAGAIGGSWLGAFRTG